MVVCPFVEDSGGGYFCDWDETYYQTHAECLQASVLTVFDQPVHITKHEVVNMGAMFGIAFTMLIMWAWFKSIL